MLQTERGYMARSAATQALYDEGLRQHMLRVYNYMASGLLLTGAVAVAFFSSGWFYAVAQTPLIWLVMLSPLAFVLALSFGINRLSTFAAQAVFWAFAAAMGLSMASIFAVYTGPCHAARRIPAFSKTAARKPVQQPSLNSVIVEDLRTDMKADDRLIRKNHIRRQTRSDGFVASAGGIEVYDLTIAEGKLDITCLSEIELPRELDHEAIIELPCSFESACDVIAWATAMMADSPTASRLWVDAERQGWRVGIADLKNGGYHLDIAGQTLMAG